MPRVHVIGAGLAGLSAALRAAEGGASVALYEAAPNAGGRCRSYYDERVGAVIDNGGHIVLAANSAAFAYLDAIGGRAAMIEVAPAAFPFLDMASGETWTIRPNAGPIPWWVFAEDRRVKRTRAADYLSALRLLRAGPDATVADCLDLGTRLSAMLWIPLTVAVMNADPRQAAAQPLARMLAATFGRGEAACRPSVAKNGLSAAFVDPALVRLAALGGEFRAGWRLVQIDKAPQRVLGLRFDAGRVDVEAGDRVVLAVPSHAAAELLPGLTVPTGAQAIVNAHFRLDREARLPGGLPLLGLVNGAAQWLIARGDIVSVTVSAADALVDRPADELLSLLWADVARALGLGDTVPPPARLIKERRATFAATPDNQRRRPAATTAWRNLFLAGDWTATGLPATIESAVASGAVAARAALSASNAL